ncbi:hypothetical protein MBLNU13_g00002t1 [Cladosporium sp. NU13]
MTIQPTDRGVQIVVINSLFVALATIATMMRVSCRVYVQKAFGWDDGFATIAWIFFVFYSSFAIAGAHHGMGQHSWNIRPASETPVALKFWWLCEPFYVLSNAAIKASIGVMLLRLCVKRSQKTAVWTVLILTGVYSTLFFFVFLFQCLPSSFFWTQYTGGSGTCMDPRITILVFYGYSALTCAGDWILSILPILVVRELQMERRDKVSAAAILAVGALASSATVARIPYFYTLQDEGDFLHATVPIALCSCTEIALGIMAASCVTLRPLLRRLIFSIPFTPSTNRLCAINGGGQPDEHKRRGRMDWWWRHERISRCAEDDEMNLQSREYSGD